MWGLWERGGERFGCCWAGGKLEEWSCGGAALIDGYFRLSDFGGCWDCVEGLIGLWAQIT